MEPERDSALDIFLAAVLHHDVPKLERLRAVLQRFDHRLLRALLVHGRSIHSTWQSCACTSWILRSPALSQTFWAHQFGEPGLFPAPKLTGLYRKPSMPTYKNSSKPSEAVVDCGFEEATHLGDQVWLGQHSDRPLPAGVRLARHLKVFVGGDVDVARHNLQEGQRLNTRLKRRSLCVSVSGTQRGGESPTIMRLPTVGQMRYREKNGAMELEVAVQQAPNVLDHAGVLSCDGRPHNARKVDYGEVRHARRHHIHHLGLRV